MILTGPLEEEFETIGQRLNIIYVEFFDSFLTLVLDISLTPFLEGFAILKKNPDYDAEETG
jgi:hypothetical protein